MKMKKMKHDVGVISVGNNYQHDVIHKDFIQEEVKKLKDEIKAEKMDVEK